MRALVDGARAHIAQAWLQWLVVEQGVWHAALPRHRFGPLFVVRRQFTESVDVRRADVQGGGGEPDRYILDVAEQGRAAGPGRLARPAASWFLS